MSVFHFRNFLMNLLKGVVSICHSFRNTGQPGRINGFDAFKLSIDVCLVTPVLAKTQILLLSAPHGETKPKTSMIAQTSANAADSLYARICLRTSNLLFSYYPNIIFSEPSLVTRASSFVYNHYPRKRLSTTFCAVMNIVVALSPSFAKQFRAIPK